MAEIVSLLEEKGYLPLAYRMFCLQSHYRKPLEFSFEVLDNVTVAYEKLVKRIADLSSEGEVEEKAYKEYETKFGDALADDVNTSMALTVVYDMLKAPISDVTKRKLVERFDEVLSLDLLTAGENLKNQSSVDPGGEQYVKDKIEERKAAKKAKDFAKADQIRDELAKEGIVLKDTREGVEWYKA